VAYGKTKVFTGPPSGELKASVHIGNHDGVIHYLGLSQVL